MPVCPHSPSNCRERDLALPAPKRSLAHSNTRFLFQENAFLWGDLAIFCPYCGRGKIGGISSWEETMRRYPIETVLAKRISSTQVLGEPMRGQWGGLDGDLWGRDPDLWGLRGRGVDNAFGFFLVSRCRRLGEQVIQNLESLERRSPWGEL